jgi:phosphoglycerol transferase MdoB-like AlkP superfamily enzyme
MLKKFFSAKNLYIAFILRILIVIFLFFLCRIIFYLFNTTLFPGVSFTDFLLVMAAGIRFDLSAIIIMNALFLIMYILPVPGRTHRIYQGISEGLFYLINGLAMMTNCVDTVYYKFTLKRTTADIFNYLAIDNGKDFFTLLPKYLVNFWYMALIWLLLVGLMIFLYRKTKKGFFPIDNRLTYYLKQVVIMCFFVLLWVFVGRGGFQLRPITIISAGEYVAAQNIPLVLNTPFTIFKTFGKEKIETIKYYPTEKELNAVYSPYHHFTAPPDSVRHLNVVIIILEGFTKEHMGYLNRDLEDGKYQGYTPFLDSLAQQGLMFTRAFSNGKKSIEGVPAVLAGLPNLMDNPYITSGYASNPINGLPDLLKKYGYSSAFFHGGTNGTMQFDAFTQLAGFDKYYGRNEYNNEKDFDGDWGIYDEPFLQYFAGKLNAMSQPFCVSAFTLSSHHPYHIPEKYKGRFRKGTLDIHQSIQYADFSLKRFFATASKMPWYKNTLFVLTADHSTPTFSSYYQNNVGNLAIPVLYYRPDGSLKGQSTIITQQIDILPSVLDYLNFSGDFIAFGESVFDTSAPHFSICYFNNVYQLIYKNMMIQFNGERIMAVYDLTSDPMLQANLVKTNTAAFREEEKFLKAFIQSYNTRMNENKLTVK